VRFGNQAQDIGLDGVTGFLTISFNYFMEIVPTAKIKKKLHTIFFNPVVQVCSSSRIPDLKSVSYRSAKVGNS
jgi:hypothetical protein